MGHAHAHVYSRYLNGPTVFKKFMLFVFSLPSGTEPWYCTVLEYLDMWWSAAFYFALLLRAYGTIPRQVLFSMGKLTYHDWDKNFVACRDWRYVVLDGFFSPRCVTYSVWFEVWCYQLKREVFLLYVRQLGCDGLKPLKFLCHFLFFLIYFIVSWPALSHFDAPLR